MYKKGHKIVRKQLVVPKSYRVTVMKLAHESPMLAHAGEVRMEVKIHNYFFWLNMQKEIHGFIKRCDMCQRIGKGHQTKVPLCITTSLVRPFQCIAMDVVGPLPLTVKKNVYILTIIDLFMQYPEAVPLKNVTVQ